MDMKMFYAELGNLLYAIADVDGIITPQEKKELHDLIASRLTQREVQTDEYGTNDAWYTEFGFDVAEEKGTSSEEAFASFAAFLETYKLNINRQTREICLALANKLAETYHYTNQKEKALIQKLKELLFSVEAIHPNTHDHA
jgi:hypothetical protein